MPYRYRIDKARRRVMSSGDGVLANADVMAHMKQLSGDPDFDPSFSQLIDFRAITEVRLSHDEIFEISTRQIFSARSKRAIVTANPVFFGLARMYQSYRAAKGEVGIRVFPDMEEALAWLELNEQDTPEKAAPT